MRTPNQPWSSSTKRRPAILSAERIEAVVLVRGSVWPASNLAITVREMPELTANSSWDQSSKPRAARIWAPRILASSLSASSMVAICIGCGT